MDRGTAAGAKIAYKTSRFARLGISGIAAGICRGVSAACATAETATAKMADGGLDRGFGGRIDFVGVEKIQISLNHV
jgi:hypothetical protein